MDITKKMQDGPWNSASYYQNAEQASQVHHPSLAYIANRYKRKEVLEIACGEGTKLANIKAKRRVGVDISPIAIKLASKKLDQAVVGNVEALPFGDQEFDAVFSFFSLEHFEHPELVIMEMIRVLRVGGELVMLTPNFGAPNRCSPCYKGSRISKLLAGFFRDFFPQSSQSLNWLHVEPLSAKHKHQQDYDTLVEPYLRSLIRYLSHSKLEIIHYSSNWQVSVPRENTLQRIFKYLGTHNIYPFKYWGPHAFVVTKKTDS